MKTTKSGAFGSLYSTTRKTPTTTNIPNRTNTIEGGHMPSPSYFPFISTIHFLETKFLP